MNTERTKPKNKTLAFFLSALPGAGHMYLGLLRQGTQFMLLFFSVIFIMNLLNIEMFGIFIPVIWFASLFDCLQKASMPELPADTNIPFVKWIMQDISFSPTPNRAKYIGYGLIFLGAYLLIEKTLLPQLENMFSLQARSLIRTSIVSFLLIGGGIKLLKLSRNSIVKKRLEE